MWVRHKFKLATVMYGHVHYVNGLEVSVKFRFNAFLDILCMLY